jgi:hypothetical protein
MDYKATIFQKGGKKVYTFPFPYLSKQFVKARYERGSTSTPLEYNRDYSIDGQTLSLHTEGRTEDILCIYRQTPTGSLVDFNDGSILLASELDKMSIQLLHVAEEQSDRLYLSGIFADADGWEARGKRIKNLLSPSDEGDAVTLGYLNSVGVAKQDEMQRIEQSVTEKATNVRLAESRVTSAAEGIRRDLNAQDIIRQEISNNKIIVDSMYKGVIAEEQRAAQHVTKAQEHADAAAASASAAAQSAQKSEHEASEAFSYVGIVKDFTRQAAESAKKAAASAGLEGLVETKHIADGAVTGAKIADQSINPLKMSSEFWAFIRNATEKALHPNAYLENAVAQGALTEVLNGVKIYTKGTWIPLVPRIFDAYLFEWIDSNTTYMGQFFIPYWLWNQATLKPWRFSDVNDVAILNVIRDGNKAMVPNASSGYITNIYGVKYQLS